MRELTIVYAGPALAGKRESIVQLAKWFPSSAFEILIPPEPVQMPALVLGGPRVSIRITARSGAVAAFDLDDRLHGLADGIVFVIDSQRERWEANEDTRDRVATHVDARRLPLAWQANRRDLSNRLSIRDLSRLDRWNAPMFESIANKGIGIWEPFEAVALMLGRRLDLDADVRALLAQRRA